MPARPEGPFAYFAERHGGATGASVRAAADDVGRTAPAYETLGEHLARRSTLAGLEALGALGTLVARAGDPVTDRARELAGSAHLAAGCVALFAEHVETFDATVAELNTQVSLRVAAASLERAFDDDAPGDGAARAAARHALAPQYAAAEDRLDADAAAVAAMLDPQNRDDTVRSLFRAGLLPERALPLYPGVPVSDDDRTAARVHELVAALEAEGLLAPGTDPDGYYRQWLENAAERGVPVETIVQIAREHQIDPDSFDVLDGLPEMTDPDGKSFFLLPDDASSDLARQAVLMTYVLNAGTDYGSASSDNDFDEAPYSSAEIQRIIDRQAANSWSYDDDVGFVHGNGGRLVTTPNGMMMGLGGSWLQDLYSQKGGTTWGDTFMLNIDEPEDAVEELERVVAGGRARYGSEGGGSHPGDLDLDRLLHHEERHSQQWADEGYAGFLASYAWEQVTGSNETEEDAGLHDGGYE